MNHKLHVLLVEDNPGDADIIREMLPSGGEQSGFTVACVNRLSEAVEHLGDKKTDVTLLDLGLPDSNGIETVRFVRKAAPNMPIVVLTGMDDEQIGVAAVQSGAQDYLVKGQIPGRHLSRVLRYAVQRQYVEEKNREYERLLQSTLDALTAHIAIFDDNGKIVATNKAWRDCAAENDTWTVNLCRDLAMIDLQNDAPDPTVDATAAFASAVKAILEGDIEDFELEYAARCGDGKRWFHGRVLPFPGNGPRRAVLAIEDITARREAQEEKIKFAAHLRQIHKIEAIGTLAGGIAHDFNNILSAVLGFTELSLDFPGLDEQIRQNLKEVYQAGIRAKLLVKQILTFARKDEAAVKPVQIGLIAKEVLRLIRSTIPSSIEIIQNIKSHAFVMADPTQIHQIFMNLCANAAHAMEAFGGTLRVDLTETNLSPTARNDSVGLPPGKYVRIDVADTGVGIAEDTIDKIFDPYFTTRQRGEGTGLGLAVVLGIVKSYGGDIQVNSEPGQGTRFTLFIPICTHDGEIGINLRPALSTGNERILLVDDEPVLASMGKQALCSLGYTVTAVTDSRGALAAFKGNPRGFDLVITDMTMPHMTGDRLSREILKIRPRTPIILCTGYSRKISREKAEAMGIRAFLMKPVTIEKIAATIRAVLDKTAAQ